MTDGTNSTSIRRRLIEHLDYELPPFWAYYYARKHRNGPWISVSELSKRSGIPRRTVIRIGSKTSWEGVDVNVASDFIYGCGFEMRIGNLISLQKVRKYLRWQHEQSKRPFGHLNDAQWRQFCKLSKRWVQQVDGIKALSEPPTPDLATPNSLPSVCLLLEKSP